MKRESSRGFALLSALGVAALIIPASDCEPRTHLSLDPSFGDEGIKILGVFDGAVASDFGQGVAVLRDGRIVIVGKANDPVDDQRHGFVALLDERGDLDPSFGDGGIVVESFEETTDFHAVTLDEAGRILVTGFIKWDGGSAFVLAKYLSDGSRDGSFGTDPVFEGLTQVSEPCTVQAYDIAVQSDGAIVATGSACPWTSRFSAVRVLADGTPDPNFGDNGVLIMDPGYSSEVLLTRDASGKRRIVIGGSVGDTGFDGNMDFALVGLAGDGSFDPVFGDGGVVVTDFGDGSPGRSEWLNAFALTPNGTILAGGSIQLLPNFQQPWQTSYDFLLAAYTSDGVLDTSFGDGGSLRMDFGSENEGIREVLVRGNGNVVVVGASGRLQWETRVAIVHLDRYGSPIRGNHRVLTALEGAGFNPMAAALDHRGRLLVVGFIRYEGGGFDIGVARYVFHRTL